MLMRATFPNYEHINFISFDEIKDYDSIIELNVEKCQLTKLPRLPNSLKRLICSNNQLTKLTKLPELPNLLQYIDCHNNKLTSLPELPNSLQILFCYNNQLTYLPKLPNSLQELYDDDNNFIKTIKYKYLQNIIY